MHTRYRANFRVGPVDGQPPAIEEVAEACVDWAMGRARPRVRLPIKADVPRKDYGRGAEIETIWIEDADAQSWALRLIHPDEDYDNIRWRTDIVLSRTRQGLMFSCDNYYGTVDGLVVPMRRQASRPRIVLGLLEKWGGYRVYALKAGPEVLRDDDDQIDHFYKFLTNPKRGRPVVYVSAALDTDEPVVNATALASYLAGVAHVWVAESRVPSEQLKSRMPQRLIARDGAVRIYWPLFSVYSDSYSHPYWRPDEIRAIEEHQRQGFKEFLLGRVSAVAIYSRDPEETRWGDLEAHRRRRVMEELRKKGDEKELLDLVLIENTHQDRKIRSLENEIQGLRRQLSGLSDAHEDTTKLELQWRKAYFTLKAGSVGEGEPELPEEPLRAPESVQEAVVRAAERFGERLVFAFNGKSEIEKNPFKYPDELYKALCFLATTYWESHVEGGEAINFDTTLRELCGWWYKGSQKENTMKKYREWYYTRWKGKFYPLPKHIGTGSSKKPEVTIRVAFEWHAKSQKVIVGYIGQHQETDAT